MLWWNSKHNFDLKLITKNLSQESIINMALFKKLNPQQKTEKSKKTRMFLGLAVILAAVALVLAIVGIFTGNTTLTSLSILMTVLSLSISTAV